MGTLALRCTVNIQPPTTTQVEPLILVLLQEVQLRVSRTTMNSHVFQTIEGNHSREDQEDAEAIEKRETLFSWP